MDATKYFSTREVAGMLGIKPNTLNRAVYDGRINEPAMIGKSRMWVLRDIEQASLVLLKRPLEDVLEERGISI